jgi:hypothetical protein
MFTTLILLLQPVIYMESMKKKRKKRTLIEEYLKTFRKGRRQDEIEQHGHPLPTHHIHLSKKVYNRKKIRRKLSDH